MLSQLWVILTHCTTSLIWLISYSALLICLAPTRECSSNSALFQCLVLFCKCSSFSASFSLLSTTHSEVIPMVLAHILTVSSLFNNNLSDKIHHPISQHPVDRKIGVKIGKTALSRRRNVHAAQKNASLDREVHIKTTDRGYANTEEGIDLRVCFKAPVRGLHMGRSFGARGTKSQFICMWLRGSNRHGPKTTLIMIRHYKVILSRYEKKMTAPYGCKIY